MKALLERGTPIRVALPLPPEEPKDLADWARAMMPEKIKRALDGELITLSAEAELLEVVPYVRDSPPQTLTEVIGAIVDGTPPGSAFTFAVDSCVVTLTPFDCRHKAGKVKWPVNVVIGGKPLLPAG